jgi:hypothetical protein
MSRGQLEQSRTLIALGYREAVRGVFPDGLPCSLDRDCYTYSAFTDAYRV